MKTQNSSLLGLLKEISPQGSTPTSFKLLETYFSKIPLNDLLHKNSIFLCISAEVSITVEEINLFQFSNVYIASRQSHKRVNYPFFMLHHLSLIYSCYVVMQKKQE